MQCKRGMTTHTGKSVLWMWVGWGGWVAYKAPNEASISLAPKSNPKLRLIRDPQYVANLWRTCPGGGSVSPTIRFYRGQPKISFMLRRRQ